MNELVGREPLLSIPHLKTAIEVTESIQELDALFEVIKKHYGQGEIAGAIIFSDVGAKKVRAIVAFFEYQLPDKQEVNQLAIYWPLNEWETKEELLLLRKLGQNGSQGPLAIFRASSPRINVHPEFVEDSTRIGDKLALLIGHIETVGWEEFKINPIEGRNFVRKANR